MNSLRHGCLVFLLVLICAINAKKYPVPRDQVNRDWLKVAKDELKETLIKAKLNTNVAKNVIFFLGDGMGMITIWASRIYTGQQKYGTSGEEYQFNFEKFDHTALAKTYNVDSQVPDSAATATAFLSGQKANMGTLGVNQNVKPSNCSNQKDNSVDTILDWSLKKGKSAGIVTTTRVTHGTPGAGYAHSASRYWESDTDFNNPDYQIHGNFNYNRKFNCTDIAKQLVRDNPNINVMLGGGRRNFLPNTMADPEYPQQTGRRSDGLDLVTEWKRLKAQGLKKHSYVWNKSQLNAVNPTNTDYLFGLFEPSDMAYELDRNKTSDPSLADMTKKAIEVLQKNNKGFFLMVEGGRIDHGHHAGKAKKALQETMEMDEAVKVAMDMTSSYDTLIVVTADHSHAFVSNGYPTRGNDILGTVDFVPNSVIEKFFSPNDGMPYLTLSYANGPGAPLNAPRTNLTGVNTTGKDFLQQGMVPISYETHGGEDVPVYARGPMSHLFTGVHEQNYLAIAMGYASCVGPDQSHCNVTPAPPLPPKCNAASTALAPGIVLFLMTYLSYYLSLKFTN